MANYYAKRRRNERGHFLSREAQAQLEAEEVDATAEEPKTKAGMSRKKRAAMMQLARDRFKQAQEADTKQAQREREDLQFYAGDQWPEALKTARAGQAAAGGLPPVPARPCLTINKTREPVRQVLNQERQSDLGIELVPADDFEGITEPIDDTEIELREGLTRRIQRESHAADARTWAFTRSTIAGRGFYGVMTRFVPGKTWDQEVYVQRFYNQAAVTLDPAHEQPDGSDAEWGFVGTWMPWDQYKAEFPSQAKKRNVISDADAGDFQAFADDQPDWFKSDGDLKAVYVTDYYYTSRTTKELAQLPDGSAVWLEEVPEGVTPTDTRTVVEKTITWCKLDGANPEPLDETEWPGHYIPIVKVVGEELQPYDNERRAEGMVRPARDSQQGFNAMVSKWVETVALSPIPPLMVAEGQVEGYEEWYNSANTRTLPYLPYKQTDLEGHPAPPPQAAPREAPIAAIAASVQMFDEAIQSTTGVPEARVGKNTARRDQSGRALKEQRESSEQGTSNYLDNLARSIRYEAMIINDLLYPIYGRPGRLARIVDAQGEAQTVMLHTPFTMQGKKPVAVPEQQGQQQPQPQDVKKYTLTEHANFNVAIKVTRSFDTRRQEQTAMIGDILSANPELMMVFGDLYFKYQDGPGHQEMAERAKAMLDPKIQAMLEAKAKGAEIPPQVQQQLAEGKQMVEGLTAKLKELEQVITTKQVEQQGKLQVAQLQSSADVAMNRENNETKLAVAELGAKVDRLTLFLEERARLGVQQHETHMSAADAGHEEMMAQMGHENAMQQAEAGIAGQGALADQGNQHALQQGVQAAALAPQPEAEG